VAALESLAQAQGRTMSDVIRALLRAELGGRGLIDPEVRP
jgi:hypothetical protein